MLTSLVFVGCNDSSQTKGSSSDKAATANAPAGYLNNAAKAHKRAVKTTDITAMNKAIESFYVQEGRFPNDLLELVERRYLPRIPTLPTDSAWDYDTNTGIVIIIKN